MDKFLICGLGNPGDEYAGTRHNTGFMVLDAFAKASNIHFEDKENIDQSRLLVVSDDVALPLGAFRLRKSGSNGGHNGLGHIIQLIGQDFARLRVGIGNDFPRGAQIDWVLGHYSEEDLKTLEPTLETGCEIIRSFVLQGIDTTMNQYNKLGKK